jgi:hypothetical protein
MPEIKPIVDNYQVLMEMAEDYASKSNELAIIRNEKSSGLLVLMAESKSCREADMKWGASARGQEETILVYYLKGLEKRMSSLRTFINSQRGY